MQGGCTRSGEAERTRRCCTAAMDDRAERTDRLVDFLCVRETHQWNDGDAVVSPRAGALLLCPSGETLGHVWRAAVGAPCPDDRRLAREIARRGHLGWVPVPVNN